MALSSLTAAAALEGACDEDAAAEVPAASLSVGLAPPPVVSEAPAELDPPEPPADDEAGAPPVSVPEEGAGASVVPEAPDVAAGPVPAGAVVVGAVPAGTVPVSVPVGDSGPPGLDSVALPAGLVSVAGTEVAGTVPSPGAVVVPGTTPHSVTVTVTAAGHSSRRMRSFMPCMLPEDLIMIMRPSNEA